MTKVHNSIYFYLCLTAAVVACLVMSGDGCCCANEDFRPQEVPPSYHPDCYALASFFVKYGGRCCYVIEEFLPQDEPT